MKTNMQSIFILKIKVVIYFCKRFCASMILECDNAGNWHVCSWVSGVITGTPGADSQNTFYQ